MSDEARIQQLLDEIFDSGRSPEEVCADCPRLLEEVRKRWQQMCVVNAKLKAMFPKPRPNQDDDSTGPRNSPSGGPGTRIGPYKLLQAIGEGGFGIVYMAEQDRPVHRRVAVKIIKPGMDSAQVIARFEAERQALALMDHQNIAKVFDAGTTDSGRPFFVMELVHGVPITKYCDDNHLTVRERLELLVPVCKAIQHAHQKGIIHRDLKPSNVLVCLYDGRPVPKVIDFGVAKAVEQRPTDH
jgi:serine/threonine protein kinase